MSFGNFVEAICNYLRSEVAQPILGEYTDRFIPFVWSAFFYVLTVNLLGLLPLEPLTDYSKYKAMCEEVLLDNRQRGFTTLILRPVLSHFSLPRSWPNSASY